MIYKGHKKGERGRYISSLFFKKYFYYFRIFHEFLYIYKCKTISQKGEGKWKTVEIVTLCFGSSCHL